MMSDIKVQASSGNEANSESPRLGRIGLAQALGLRPLDRLMINSARLRAEYFEDLRRGDQQSALPYWYFQRVTPSGLLEVMAPGGWTEHVSPEDVCDFIPGVPIEVRAMPKSVFISRSRLSSKDRQAPVEADYKLGYVRYVSKDRWKRLDQVFVQFHDETLNDPGRLASPIHDEDRLALARLVSRNRMPVLGPGSTNRSADKGVERSQQLYQYAATAFIQAALRGHKPIVEVLAKTGIQALTAGQINRLKA